MYRKRRHLKVFLYSITLITGLIAASLYATILQVDRSISHQRSVPVSYLSPEVSSSSTKYLGYEYERPATGKFLVASDQIRGPIFAETVILLIDYNTLGAVGLIVNRPTEIKLLQVVPDIEGAEQMPDNVYFGGPVAINQMLLLVQSSTPPEESIKLWANIYVSSSRTLLQSMINNKKMDEKFRIYAGYAGWSAGQLEAEIMRGDWHVVKGVADLIFDKTPGSMWQKLVPSNLAI